jgi:hypothetical protein
VSRIDQTILNDILIQSLNAFLCSEDLKTLEGIGNLAILESCLKFCDSKLQTSTETLISILETFCGLKNSNIELFYYQELDI